MKAVHFGAGNIGRGFIGLMLANSGFEICFVDVNETMVSLLQQRGKYTVEFASESHETTVVSNVTALNGNNLDEVVLAVAGADLVTTAVGVSTLKHIAEAIAQGIELRLRTAPSPLQIIACENAIGGSTQLKKHVYSLFNETARELANRYIVFPDAAVDRIVPLQKHEDPLKVVVEPFSEWVVERSALPEGGQEIKGVHYVDDLLPYIERKLFTVNTGHCCAAYYGFVEGYETIQEAMKNERLKEKVLKVLEETGAMLVKTYKFDEDEHRKYIFKILDRFTNPYLTDEVIRVARSPIRKISPDDRLIRPALRAYELGISTYHLAAAVAAALRFDYKDDPECVELQKSLRRNGLYATIRKYTGTPENHPFHRHVAAEYEALLEHQAVI